MRKPHGEGGIWADLKEEREEIFRGSHSSKREKISKSVVYLVCLGGCIMGEKVSEMRGTSCKDFEAHLKNFGFVFAVLCQAIGGF